MRTNLSKPTSKPWVGYYMILDLIFPKSLCPSFGSNHEHLIYDYPEFLYWPGKLFAQIRHSLPKFLVNSIQFHKAHNYRKHICISSRMHAFLREDSGESHPLACAIRIHASFAQKTRTYAHKPVPQSAGHQSQDPDWYTYHSDNPAPSASQVTPALFRRFPILGLTLRFLIIHLTILFVW